MTDSPETMSKPGAFSRARLRAVRQADAITPAPRDGGPLHASSIQRVFWYLAQVEKAGAAYVLQSAITVEGTLDPALLQASLDHLAERHEMLRTRFAMTGERLVLEIGAATGAFPLTVHVSDDAQIRAAAIAEPMDLRHGPLARAHLFGSVDGPQTLLILLHHTIADHDSFDVLWRDLCATYDALTSGEEPVPTQCLAYADFAAWEQAARRDTERRFWREALTDCPPLSTPPPDHRRGASFDHAGATHALELDAELATALDRFASAAGVTPFAVGLTAWALLLQGTTGASDIVTGVPVSNRDRPELQGIVGPFLNTLAIRLGPLGHAPANKVVGTVQESFLTARQHQGLTIDQVIELVDPPRSPSHNPLYQTMFSWNTGAEAAALQIGGQRAQFESLDSRVTQLDLTLDIVAGPQGLSARFDYATQLFDAATIAGYAARYRDILTQLVTMPDGHFAIIDPADFAAPSMLDGPALPLDDTPIHLRIAARAAARPEAIAITDGSHGLTYTALDGRANHLAHRLIAAGVRPGDFVCICLPRSADAFIAALAVLKAGAAYVPLDPADPAARLAHIVSDCGAVAVIATDGAYPVPRIVPEDGQANAPDVTVAPDAPAYAIYTSGSTGQPKGVVVSHAAIAAMVDNWGHVLAPDAETVILQMARFAFDVATADMLRALCFGGRLVICPAQITIDGAAVAALIRDQGVTMGDFTPAVLDQLLEQTETTPKLFENLRQIICGSDIWSLAAARRLRAAVPASCRIIHAYGLTETVVDALYFDLDHLDGTETQLPLGEPFPNGRVTITDPEGRPVLQGQEGEIRLSGPCLATGYIGAQGGFIGSGSDHSFRTGDAGRLNAAGQIEFLGRLDKQIKIRGYRIDPAEIEARLLRLGVAGAHVVARDGVLLAYVTGVQEPDALHQMLADDLPDFMRPARVIPLDRFPLTVNGKIDDAALPAPDFSTVYEPPQTATAQCLATLWEAHLGGGPVGLSDNFFERGGHSMMAVRMALAATEALGRPVDGALVFAHPRLGDFADVIDAQAPARPGPIKRVRTTRMRPTAGQEALWFLAQDPRQNAAYNMPFGLRLAAGTDMRALLDALQGVVDRHEALRCCFVAEDGQPMLEIRDRVVLQIRRIEGTQEALAELARAEAATAFDLATAPLIRACLVTVSDGDDALFVTLHHIIADGWSIDLFGQELATLYDDFTTVQATGLPPIPLQFGDYAAWQRELLDSNRKAAQLAFWEEALRGAPSLLALPTDRPRPAVQDFAGDSLPVTLDAAQIAPLRQMARAQGTTVFAVVLAAWSYLMSRLSGDNDIVTGVPSANRGEADTAQMIGYLVNTLAIRADLSMATPRDLIAQISATLARAQAHQDLPFSSVVAGINPQRSQSHSPIFQTMLAWESATTAESGETPLAPFAMPLTNVKYDLVLEVTDTGAEISGTLQFASALFDRDTVARFADYLRHVLAGFAATPDAPLAGIGLAEHALPTPEPLTQPDARILDRFAAQVQAQPDARALLAGERQLSYAELDAQSLRFAGHLAQLGITPETPVALWADRSPEMIVAVLGILRAGGVVVPIDPAYPLPRIAHILNEAAPLALFARDPTAPIAAGVPAAHVRPTTCDADPLAPGTGPGRDDAAYILYTSGTTGQPKGVVQTHRMLDNLIDWQLALPGHPERVLQFASLCFDVSFQETLSALCGGATLVMMTREQVLDVAHLPAFIAQHDIQRAFLPVAVLQAMAPAAIHIAGRARCEIVTAGEALEINDTLRQALPALGAPRLCNHYGPTETHAVSHHILLVDEIADWPVLPPIGTAIANTRLYILDTTSQPVPDGVVGELYLGGASVAKGYFKQPALTAARFLPDPFAPEPGARMFKSGDLVRRDGQGGLHFLGRADDQVKIRGYRVEPKEVEAVLRQHPDVTEAAVLARVSPAGQTQLVAYHAGSAKQDALRQHMETALPDYMHPAHWVALPQLPLNTSGKIARNALPDPDWSASASTGAALSGPVEEQIGQIWAEALGLAQVHADDDFFALGGHSLIAARILHAVNSALGSALHLSDLFAAPVLRDLAKRADAAQADKPGTLTVIADPANRHAPFPLSDIQQAYLVGRDENLGLGGVAAHSYNELQIRDFDIARFEAALNRVIARHDMLRTVFQGDGQQVTLAEVPPYMIAVQDLSEADTNAQEAGLHTTRARMSHQVLDAGTWPLFAYEVTRLPDDICHLHISLDALIVDAASMSLLMGELLQFYLEPDTDLPPVGVTFRDYILTERQLRDGDSYRVALDHWLDRFDEMPTGPDLPLVVIPGSVTAPQFTRYERTIPRADWDRIKENAALWQITPSALLLASFSLVLQRYAQTPGFSLSLPLFNRLPLHPQINDVIGDFTSVLLFQTSAAERTDFAGYAREVQQALWRDMDHAKVSGIEVMRALGRKFGQSPEGLPVVFNSTLTEMDDRVTDQPLAGRIDARNVHTITQTPQVWLDHTIMSEDGALIFNWDSIDALFPEGLIAAMFADYCGLLDRLQDRTTWEAAPARLFESNATAQEAVADLPVLHDMVRKQAALTPNATAVISATRTLDYQTLLTEAETLAARLQADGCAKGDIVAILLPPGWEQVVAVLGILIAGDAYLPLDPDLPAARITSLLQRTNARQVVVAQGSDWTAGPNMTRLELIADPEPATPQPVAVTDTDLAYVIFTSGSTGAPKGVMIDHGGAANTILDINARIGMTATDRILGVSALNFDLSVYDIFGPLSTGAALVMPQAEARRDPAHWRDLIRDHGVTVWNSVPALAGLLVEGETGAPLGLREAMMSGDWIPLDLPDRLRAAAPGITLWSLGGATEASIWSVGYPIGAVDSDWASIPYGTALDGQSIDVLDTNLNPRPDWVTGEIHIGGRGVALGYWDDVDRTEAAFVTHPVTGARLYRTGDLGRRLPDGNIQFLGRADTQVKVQGHRIELGSIETALERHPGITAAAARIWGAAMEQKQLAGYVVARDTALTEAALRDYLADHLPAYEIPAAITFLDALPLSANGKVDRKQLPEPMARTATTDDFAYRDTEEARISQIVTETLKQGELTAQENLLARGASSLDIVRICNAIAAGLGFRPPLARFMRMPTIAALIALWRDREPDAMPQATEELTEITDEGQRSAFKAAEKGLRRFDTTPPAVLDIPVDPQAERYETNRSTRQFLDAPVDSARLARALAGLTQNANPGRPRYQYASAGGLYPVQTYLYVKPDRVTGLAGGCYYLHPVDRVLIPVGNGGALSPDNFDYFVNRPTFESAAFAVFFIADMAAIAPLYGESSRDMVLIEAGQMAQHLTNDAAALGLGLCGIGSMKQDDLCALFGLGPHHRLAYAMLGGSPDNDPPAPPPSDETEEFEI